jgi:phosphoserine phosphatase
MESLMLNKLPLCVDLDGTLIRTDILQEMILKYLWRWPYKLINLMIWLVKGRAFLKQQLANYVTLKRSELPLNQAFLAWLQQERAKGRQLLLVTAADYKPASAIAQDLGIFDVTLASNGKENLRADAKAKALVHRYGEGLFAYAGNSQDDLKVWAKAGEMIAVNAPKRVVSQAKQLQKPLHIFQEGLRPWHIVHALWRPPLLGLSVPMLLSYWTRQDSLILQAIFFTAAFFLGLSGALFADLLCLRTVPQRNKSVIFHALQQGAVPIPLAIYGALGLLIVSLLLMSLLPLYAVLSLCLLGILWWACETYPPSHKAIKTVILMVLASQLYCASVVFLNP